MYDRDEIKEIIDEIVFLKKYALFDKQGYDEKAKIIEELKSDLCNAFGIDEWYKLMVSREDWWFKCIKICQSY